jgi:hypothetical protein
MTKNRIESIFFLTFNVTFTFPCKLTMKGMHNTEPVRSARIQAIRAGLIKSGGIKSVTMKKTAAAIYVIDDNAVISMMNLITDAVVVMFTIGRNKPVGE